MLELPSSFQPIANTQLEAAVGLRDSWLSGWSDSATALYEMRENLPGDDLSSTLGRVSAVNSLYNAGLSSVLAMARHIQALGPLRSPGDLDDAWEAVKAIAFLPGRSTDAEGCQVFASKYAHFIVCPEGFPIYDQHAARALMRHFGVAPRGVLSGPERYRRFCQLLKLVIDGSPEITGVTYAELDVYLWLAGAYRAWDRKRRGLATEGINRETSGFFENHGTDSEVARLLESLTQGSWFMEPIPEVGWPS